MRVGVDIDGVLADFNTRFIEEVIATTGKDLFPPRPFDIPTWDYPQHYGYTREEVHAVWERLKANRAFWMTLPPYLGAMNLIEWLRETSQQGHFDLYFITSRPGEMAKYQTEVWLAVHGGDITWTPTVLISSEKGKCADALRLTHYLDDKWENCHDVEAHTTATVFMLDQPWNQRPAPGAVKVIEDISEFRAHLHDQLFADLTAPGYGL